MNSTAQYEFTVIVPVYDEKDNIERLEKELGKFLREAPVKSCVLFVDDGSKDGSGDLLRGVCGRNPDMFCIRLGRNRGLSAAMKAGIDHTYSEYLGYIDADLQTDPEDFALLLEHAADYPLVMGIRTGRKDSFVKNASSKIANGFRRMMTGDGVTDTGCPLKVMRASYAKRIPFFTGMHRFLPALILLQDGGKVKEIPVRHYPRTAGQSKYHLWNRLAGPFKDCFAYRWMKKRYINYTVSESDL
ncbi:MAG: glycosyltransferase [Rikenellaceae bacterium]|nr:glycosyltransferase [Rikenellaceae bacterium]